MTHGSRSGVDIWILNNETEVAKRKKKRIKKLKRERENSQEADQIDDVIKSDVINDDVILQDRIKNNHMTPISFTSGGKLRGLDLIKTKNNEYKAIAAHSSNQIQVHQCQFIIMSHNL